MADGIPDSRIHEARVALETLETFIDDVAGHFGEDVPEFPDLDIPELEEDLEPSPAPPGVHRRAAMRRIREQHSEFGEGVNMSTSAREKLSVNGEKLRDRNGKRLGTGDYVEVTGSDRYGTTRGYVTGVGPDQYDGKQRVAIRLEDGRNDEYTPSTGRVERLTKAS